MEQKELLKKIADVVRECGTIILHADRSKSSIDEKAGHANFVTEYDKRIQQTLQKSLLGILPEAVFVGEEEEVHASIAKGYAFIVDPIDGTANFIRGFDASCISVALTENGSPILGVVYDPYRRETYYAERGKGAYRNGERIHASERTLEEGVILFGVAPYHKDLMKKSFEVAYRYVSRGEDLRRSGSAAIDLCMVASGRAEFFFELVLSPWDYAAGALLVEEAGGFTGDLEGRPLTYDRKQTVTARAPRVELLDLS